MKSQKLKQILDSLVAEQDRDFLVEINGRTYKRVSGVYFPKQKVIRVYGGVRQESIWAIMVGIHELAHHLDNKACCDSWNRLWQEGKRRPFHGSVFRQTMGGLIREFNARYSQVLGGVIVYDRRRP